MAVFAVDGGYSCFKGKFRDKRVFIPSVVGTADQAHFSIDGNSSKGIVIEHQGRPWLVGDEAVSQSAVVIRREDRSWILTDEYLLCWYGVLSELTRQFRQVEVQVVTGLPVDYYTRDRSLLVERLLGEHAVKRAGRQSQSFNVTEVLVIPQLFGTLFALTLDQRGRPVSNAISDGRVGFIDCGGHNCNFGVVEKMKEIRPQTRSIDQGCWTVVDAVRASVDAEWPGLGLRDHEVIEAVKRRKITYRGQHLDIGRIVDAAVEPLSRAIMGVCSQLWNGANRLDMIVVSGGGAHLLAQYVTQAFPSPDYPAHFVQIVGDWDRLLPELVPLAGSLDPVFANVEGFDRYGKYKWGTV